MTEAFTVSQKQRLTELNAPEEILRAVFATSQERDTFFKEAEARLARENKEKIRHLLEHDHRPLLCAIEDRLVRWLTEEEGFTQVVTPIIIPKNKLDKMTITSDHPLHNQVFWLDPARCLRPMLAPNLYELMRDIRKAVRQPVRIFEVGPCFRKESQGAQHLAEFTMLNLVEFASVKEGEQMARLKELATGAMKAIGFDNYAMEITESEVYGETLDIVAGDLELASGAYGPHKLDSAWGIFDSWVGIGIGLERVAMAMGGYQNIKRVGRSLSYLDGARLNV